MLRIQVRANSTASIVQAQLAARLETYFEQTTFKFLKPQHVDELRKAMELVYLRKRPLVSIDIEAYERKQKLITELGVAIYDPENQWLLMQPHVRTLHIISDENRRFLNSQFVPNHKYYFNGSTSYQMKSKLLLKFLKETFRYFFEDRGAVIVGHHLSGDIKWVKSHGVKMTVDMPQVDTQKLFHLSRRRGATLRGILHTVDIPHAKLHNAANDAYYTLLAAMRYCDPECRQHYNLDTFVDQSKPTDQEKKEARRPPQFREKAHVLKSYPPSMNEAYPRKRRNVAVDDVMIKTEDDVVEAGVIDIEEDGVRKHVAKTADDVVTEVAVEVEEIVVKQDAGKAEASIVKEDAVETEEYVIKENAVKAEASTVKEDAGKTEDDVSQEHVVQKGEDIGKEDDSTKADVMEPANGVVKEDVAKSGNGVAKDDSSPAKETEAKPKDVMPKPHDGTAEA